MARPALDIADYMADPLDTAQSYQDNIMKGLESNNLTAKGAAVGQMFNRAANGGMDPATQKATMEQNAVKESLTNMAPQGKDENDIDFNIRQHQALYNSLAPIDAQQAMRVADHIATLSEARSQQKLLDARATEAEQETAVKQATQGTLVLTNTKGDNLGTVNRFLPGTSTPDPAFADNMKQMQSDNPGSFPTTSEKFMSDKAALLDRKAMFDQQLALVKAQAKAQAGNLSDDELKQHLEDKATYGMTGAFSRLPPETRAAINKYQAASGIRDTDMIAAQNQIAGLRREAGAIGAREGNIAILSTSLRGLVNRVNVAAQGVNRTDLTALNSAIIGGKQLFSDPGEQRYAVAVQGLITDYARIMSNGVGQTSDTSREHASMLLPLNKSKASMAAAGDQMEKEVKTVSDAANEAMETAAHPERYTALMKVQKALWGDDHSKGLIDFDTKTSTAAAARPGQTASGPKTINFSDLPQ